MSLSYRSLNNLSFASRFLLQVRTVLITVHVRGTSKSAQVMSVIILARSLRSLPWCSNVKIEACHDDCHQFWVSGTPFSVTLSGLLLPRFSPYADVVCGSRLTKAGPKSARDFRKLATSTNCPKLASQQWNDSPAILAASVFLSQSPPT